MIEETLPSNSLIHDPDQAYEMAHAGKAHNEAAMQKQKLAERIGSSIAELPKVVDQLGDTLKKNTDAARLDAEATLVRNKAAYSDEAEQEKEDKWHKLLDERNELSISAEAELEKVLEKHLAPIQSSIHSITKRLDKWQKEEVLLSPDHYSRGEGSERPETYNAAIEEFTKDEVKVLGHRQINEKRNAERLAAVAGRLEEWAGILYDHPPSDDYKELHGDLGDLTPEYLVELEEEVRQRETDLQNFELVMDRFLEINDESYQKRAKRVLIDNRYSNTVYHLLARARTTSDVDTGTRFDTLDLAHILDTDESDFTRDDKLSDDRIARLAYRKGSVELKKFNNRLELAEDETIAVYIDALRRAVKVLTTPHRLQKAMLEEIRSGRAAQWKKM